MLNNTASGSQLFNQIQTTAWKNFFQQQANPSSQEIHQLPIDEKINSLIQTHQLPETDERRAFLQQQINLRAQQLEQLALQLLLQITEEERKKIQLLLRIEELSLGVQKKIRELEQLKNQTDEKQSEMTKKISTSTVFHKRRREDSDNLKKNAKIKRSYKESNDHPNPCQPNNGFVELTNNEF